MSIHCTECGALIPDGERFCSECGAPVKIHSKRICPSCGAEVPDGEKYCSECGTPVALESPAPENFNSVPNDIPVVEPKSSTNPITPSATNTNVKQANPSTAESKGKRNYLVYGIIAAVVIGIIGFMFRGSDKNSTSKNVVNELELLKPIAIKQEVDEKHFKDAIDILKKLGVDMSRVSIENADLGTIWVSSPEDCHQQDYQLQLLFFRDTKELYEIDITGYQEEHPGKKETNMSVLFVTGRLYDKRNGGIWHKLTDLYITKDRQTKMEKAIAQKFPENWSEPKFVKKYTVPLLREETSINKAKKTDVKFLYIALVEYKRKFYGGESTGREIFEATFDDNCNLLKIKSHEYGRGYVTDRQENAFGTVNRVRDDEIFTWSQTVRKAKPQGEAPKNNSEASSTKEVPASPQPLAQQKPDNSQQQPSVPPITKDAIVSAKHSSADNEDGYNHSAALTTDGDTKTCWAEGVPGLGIGENITYYFNTNYKVSGLTIWTGHQKTEDLFYKNARPTAIRVVGSDGSSVIYPLNDVMGMQRVTFNTPITVNNIKLVVEKVAPGNKYEDTCIAEVNFF